MNSKDATIPRIKNSKMELDKKLLQPYTYILQIPGLNFKEALLDMFNYWLETPDHIMRDIHDIVTILLNASLMVDDIQDGSNVRRGIPTAHVIYGIPATLNAANYMMFTGFQKFHYLTSHKGCCLDWEFLLDLLRGQGLEIHQRENYTCPTEEEYCRIAILKTASFFTFSVKLVQAFSKNKHDLNKLASLMGLYFQVRDDYVNLVSPEYHQYKGFCEDISEGKFSFPLVHAINTDPNSEVLEILKMRTTDVDLKKRCLSLLQNCGSLEYTKNKLNCLRDEILNEVEKLGGHPTFKKYFEAPFYS